MRPLVGNPGLDAWLASVLPAREARVETAEKLSGGAIQESWGLDVIADGERHRLVLRRDSEGTIAASRSRRDEHRLVEAAWAGGVAVPRPIGFCDDPAIAGGPFSLVGRVTGVGYGPKVVRDRTLGGDRTALGRELGRQLARIHAISPDAALAGILGPRPNDPALAQVAHLRRSLDDLAANRPGLEWGLRWAERFAPPPGEVVVSHQDFRTGNFMVDQTGLTAILDWEFAGWSDPMSDLGWFCAECWRFSRPDLEAGGLCDRAPFYEGYEAESGRRIDAVRVRWWEILAHIRWAVIALQQGRRRASGTEALGLALTGRIADSLELMVLRATAPGKVLP
jgi:aminoglycoside phosphotransferase (APT) family kinase protein